MSPSCRVGQVLRRFSFLLNSSGLWGSERNGFWVSSLGFRGLGFLGFRCASECRAWELGPFWVSVLARPSLLQTTFADSQGI